MKHRCLRAGAKFLQILSICVLGAVIGQAQVKVVNMIPNSMSNETNRDSEPNIAVDPSNKMRIAGSAFTDDPLLSGNGPIFVSTDGGLTWTLNVVLPGGNRTGDVTLRFARTSGVLYAGILRKDNGNLNILRKANFLLPGLMTILVDRADDDQPYVEATTVISGGINFDRIYIGNNDFSVSTTTGRTATVDFSLDAATAAAPAGFGPVRLETRATASTGSGNQDGPSVRCAIHPSGTIYAAYFGWRTFGGATNTTDVVVVRDDNWAMGTMPFTNLTDTGDLLAGVRVVTGVSVPALSTLLGTQRIGSQLSIAVDPTNSQTVYLAWADGTGANNYTIHVRRSINGGVAWSGDLRTIVMATNPALAINSQGKVGFLYQRLTGTTPNQRWETHFETTTDGFATAPMNFTLANVPDQNGTYAGANPIGDYLHLMAADRDFYGIFSANNTPNMANFPSGVTYQRNANFTTNTLLSNDNVTTVPVSIDPFFFVVKDQQADLAITKTDSPDPVVTGSNITYTINVTNTGPSDATSVVVTDNLPSTTSFVSCSFSGGVGGVCGGAGNNRAITFTSIPAATTATVTLVTQANCTVGDGVMISNTASVSSPIPDPNLANNTATTTTTASNPAPVITCPGNVTAPNTPGQCFAILNPGTATATDNCPGVMIAGVRSDGQSLASPYPVGSTVITWTATDSGGKTASCAQTIKVNDVEPPKVTCPKDQVAITPKPGDVSTVVTYPAPAVMDNCPGATVVCLPASGSVFPLGMTTVNCTATDMSGNTATCSFKVTVFDVCLQDDASKDSLAFNSFTGEYLFTRCATGFTLAGKGTIDRTGCLTKLTEAKIEATLDRCIIAPHNRGSVTIKPNPIGGWFYINDSNTANNTCICP